MELKVIERMVLLNVLPVTGTLINLRLVRELREGLSFSDEENQSLAFKNENGKIFWDDTDEVAKDVEISATMMDLVIGAFGVLDVEAKLHLDQIGVFERFLMEKGDREARVKDMVDGKG